MRHNLLWRSAQQMPSELQQKLHPQRLQLRPWHGRVRLQNFNQQQLLPTSNPKRNLCLHHSPRKRSLSQQFLLLVRACSATCIHRCARAERSCELSACRLSMTCLYTIVHELCISTGCIAHCKVAFYGDMQALTAKEPSQLVSFCHYSCSPHRMPQQAVQLQL